MAKGVGPREIAPTVGGKNGGYVLLFRSAKFRYVPDALLEYFLPVLSLMDFTSDTNGFDDEAIFLR